MSGEIVAKAKPKKVNIFKRMGRKIKEVFSELKKVTWPTFNKTMQQTLVVIVVVVCFTIVFSLSDWGLSALLKALTKGFQGV